MTPAGIVALVTAGAAGAIRAFVPKARPLVKPIESLPDMIGDVEDHVRNRKLRKSVRRAVRWVDDLDDAIAKMVPEVDEHVPEDVRDAFGVVLVWASCKIAGVPYAAPKPKRDPKPTPTPSVGSEAMRDLAPAGRVP